jgi:hypothetical protein
VKLRDREEETEERDERKGSASMKQMDGKVEPDMAIGIS